MRVRCITLYITMIQALQQLFIQQIIQLHTRPPALTLNLQDSARSPQVYDRDANTAAWQARSQMRFGSQMHLHIDESIAAAPSVTVSAAHACERGH